MSNVHRRLQMLTDAGADAVRLARSAYPFAPVQLPRLARLYQQWNDGSMPIDPHTAAAAVGLVNSAFSSVKTALDLAKKATDLDLKHEVSKAFDNVLELKATVYELAEENRILRESLKEKATIKREPQWGFWLKDGESDPLCPTCYEGPNSAVVYLAPVVRHGYAHERLCNVCKSSYRVD